jgi:site-specific DNA recombinase
MTTTKTTVQAAIYCRISKDDKDDHAGVDRQLADCQELAERKGWQIARTYTDNDISASTFTRKHRPGYAALCEDIKNGVVNAVLAYHPERLHRRTVELEEYITLCGDRVRNETVMGGQWDLSTATGRMIARSLGNVAQYDSEQKAEKIRRQKLEAARNGGHNGGMRCWGYEGGKGIKIADGAGMTIRESEATEIRRIADAIIKGVSMKSLARELNQRGVPTVTGQQAWSQGHLRSAMISPRLAGLRVHHGEVVGKGQWPAILDESTYAAMLSIVCDPKRQVTGQRMGRTATSLGTGLYVCGGVGCGQPTLRLSKDNAGRTVYRCGSLADDGLVIGPKREHVNRRADKLDQYVTDALIARLSQPGFVQAMADRVAAHGNSDQAALVTERDEIRTALNELASAAESGSVTTALAIQLARQTRELTERAEEIKHLLAQSGQRSPLADLIGVTDIEQAWHALSLPVQRAILAAVVTVTVHRGRRGRDFDVASVDLAFK